LTSPTDRMIMATLVRDAYREYSALEGGCYGCAAWSRSAPGRTPSIDVYPADLLAARKRRNLHHPGHLPRCLAPWCPSGVQRTYLGSFQRLPQRPKLWSDGQCHGSILSTKGLEIRDRSRIYMGRGSRRGGQEADVPGTEMIVDSANRM
jgi:hypothetical protein